MTTKLDPKFLALLADTAQKLQALEIQPRVLEDAAPVLTTTAAELSQLMIDFTTTLTAAMEAKVAADIAAAAHLSVIDYMGEMPWAGAPAESSAKVAQAMVDAEEKAILDGDDTEMVERLADMAQHCAGIQLADENLGERPARFLTEANDARYDAVRAAYEDLARRHPENLDYKVAAARNQTARGIQL